MPGQPPGPGGTLGGGLGGGQGLGGGRGGLTGKGFSGGPKGSKTNSPSSKFNFAPPISRPMKDAKALFSIPTPLGDIDVSTGDALGFAISSIFSPPVGKVVGSIVDAFSRSPVATFGNPRGETGTFSRGGEPGGGGDGPGFFPNTGLPRPAIGLTAGGLEVSPAAQQSVFDAVQSELEALGFGGATPFLNSVALEAALADVEKQRVGARADISKDQERRRIGGTPFANDLLSQSDREFEKSKALIRGQAREAALENMFRQINLEFSQINAELNRELGLFRIQTGVTQAAQAIAFSASQFEQELAAREAAAEGEFFGTLASLLAQII